MPCVDSYWVLPDAHTAFSENVFKKSHQGNRRKFNRYLRNQDQKSIKRGNQIVFKADETQWKVRQKRDL